MTAPEPAPLWTGGDDQLVAVGKDPSEVTITDPSVGPREHQEVTDPLDPSWVEPWEGHNQ